MKKGQKSDENEATPMEEEKSEGFQMIDENPNDDDDWFTVKKVSDLPETVDEEIDLTDKTEKTKKLTKAKLARKLRKKHLLINQRIEYDEEGNVRNFVNIERINDEILFHLIAD